MIKLCSHLILAEVLGTIDYVAPDGTIIFRTCSAEKDKVVFQMGTCDAKRALKVAKIMQGGMGAALLEQPEKVREILTTLVNGIKKPVTCKIRILPNLEETLNLVKIIESTGVKALAVHGRIRTQRSSQPCNYDVISEISKSISIPVIANGGSLDVKSFDEIERFRKNTCCSSVMLARAAEWNPSVFRRQGLLSTQNEIKDYLTYALMFDHNFPGTKYCICQLMHKSLDTDDGQKLLASKTFDELCEIFGMKSQLNQVVEKRRRKLGEIEEEEVIMPLNKAIFKKDLQAKIHYLRISSK
eukprot:gene17653-9303_t